MKFLKFSGKPKKPRFIIIRRVVGPSMIPTLKPGKIVLALAKNSNHRKGDVVIAKKDHLEIIKRIEKINQKKYFLVGDNSFESTDSRQLGWFSKDQLSAKVIWPRLDRI